VDGTLVGGALVARRTAGDPRFAMRLSAAATLIVALLLVFLFAESKPLAYVGFALSIVFVGFHDGPSATPILIQRPVNHAFKLRFCASVASARTSIFQLPADPSAVVNRSPNHSSRSA
jgi:hypothetical protein